MSQPIQISAGVAQYREGLHSRTETVPFANRLTDIASGSVPVAETVSLDSGTGQWRCELGIAPANQTEPSHRVYDLEVRFSLQTGFEAESDVAVSLRFADWSTGNYVMLPAAVYAGNRFESRDPGYPPLLEAPADLGTDCPTIISNVPRLAAESGTVSRLQQLTRDLAAPTAVLHLPATRTGVIVHTPQEIAPWGDLL